MIKNNELISFYKTSFFNKFPCSKLNYINQYFSMTIGTKPLAEATQYTAKFKK